MFFPLDARGIVRLLLSRDAPAHREPVRRRAGRVLTEVAIAMLTWRPRWSLRSARRGG